MRFSFPRKLVGLLFLTFGCSSAPQADAAQAGREPAGAGTPPERTSAQPSQASAPLPQVEMVPVPGATFHFGASESQFLGYYRLSTMWISGMKDDLRARFVVPPREVQVQPFRMDVFEVTNQQFLAFLAATDYSPSDGGQDFLRHWLGRRRYPDWAELFPVVWVSPQDAAAYCRWRGARLPSEEEWEWAARSSDGRVFPWGNSKPDPHETAVFAADQAEPVGNRPGDVSPFQIYDLGGNVAEWTSTVVSFKGQRQFVFRGGSYREAFRELLVYNRRFEAYDHPRNDYTGFRCVKDGQ